MRTSLCGLFLVGLLLSPAAEARNTGGHAAGATVPFTGPFQATVGIARQAAKISRLRAQQATADRITASGGLVGAGGFLDLGGVDGFGPALGVARVDRSPPVARLHIVTVTPSSPMPGQVQIIRGTSVETVQLR